MTLALKGHMTDVEAEAQRVDVSKPPEAELAPPQGGVWVAGIYGLPAANKLSAGSRAQGGAESVLPTQGHGGLGLLTLVSWLSLRPPLVNS